jgi:hypothetical protein
METFVNELLRQSIEFLSQFGILVSVSGALGALIPSISEVVRQSIESLSQFGVLVSLSGGLVALASIGVSVITLLVNIIIIHRKLSQASDSGFNKTLESDNLIELGSYIENIIGSFTIHEYTRSQKAQDQVDKIFNKVRYFVGSEDEVEKETLEPPRRETSIASPPSDELASVYGETLISDELASLFSDELASVSGESHISKEFTSICWELQTGTTWNALAQLRRLIETELRAYAEPLKMERKHLRSAGKLLRLLLERQKISGEIFEPLQFAVKVANQAIHGHEIDEPLAENAISLAIPALIKLRSSHEETLL